MAYGDLFQCRRAVAGWSPIEIVGDVTLLALLIDGAEHSVQQLAGRTNKGQSLSIFVRAGCFANKYETRLWVAVAYNCIGCRAFKAAPVKLADGRNNILNRLATLREFPRTERCGTPTLRCRA